MLKDVVEACRQQTNESGDMTETETQDAIHRLMNHALRELDAEGRAKAFVVVDAAIEFLDFYGRLPGDRKGKYQV